MPSEYQCLKPPPGWHCTREPGHLGPCATEPDDSGILEPAVAVDLLSDGVLWMINCAVFHPRGFALAWDPERHELSLQGDGTERWAFAEDEATAAQVDEKFLAFKGLLARAARDNRIE